jgi:hypothetical protein
MHIYLSHLQLFTIEFLAFTYQAQVALSLHQHTVPSPQPIRLLYPLHLTTNNDWEMDARDPDVLFSRLRLGRSQGGYEETRTRAEQPRERRRLVGRGESLGTMIAARRRGA